MKNSQLLSKNEGPSTTKSTGEDQLSERVQRVDTISLQHSSETMDHDEFHQQHSRIISEVPCTTVEVGMVHLWGQGDV